MRNTITTVTRALLLGLLCAGAAQAAPGKPNFMPALYGDGEVWGTKGTTGLPAPNDNNRQSFDALYVITEFDATTMMRVPIQMSVAEASPGNPEYNGGRWLTHTVEWTEAGLMAFNDEPPVLTSSAEIDLYAGMGYLSITTGSFPDGPPLYFQCPMLPVK